MYSRCQILAFDLRIGRLALSETFVHNAVVLLVDKIIPLKEADLQEWSEDPEEFFNVEDKESDHWEYELRVSFHFLHCSYLLLIPVSMIV